MDVISLQQKTERFKDLAFKTGFMHCGISKANFLEKEARDLEKWLTQGKNGQMKWIENYFDIRLDPRLLIDNAKTVLTFAYNYYPPVLLERENNYKISKYAYGRDYHKVIKKKLKHLLNYLREEFGNFNGRAFVDSAPIMEKVWAKKSGITWHGKHTNAINPKTGSFFFLATLIVDVELEYDSPIKDRCGNCTLCLEACPTDALSVENPYQIDGSKCISYFTIELKEKIPSEMKGKFDDWIFGCDICQDVCPWNKRKSAQISHNESDFLPSELLQQMTKKDWQELTHELFNELFVGSAVKRTKFEGLKRNIEFVSKQNKNK